jgi:hypothetical protein
MEARCGAKRHWQKEQNVNNAAADISRRYSSDRGRSALRLIIGRTSDRWRLLQYGKCDGVYAECAQAAGVGRLERKSLRGSLLPD